MQRMAKRALVDGLVAYDHRHGWRGVDTNVALTGGDWGLLFNKIEKPYSDIQPWRQAIVLGIEKRSGSHRSASEPI